MPTGSAATARRSSADVALAAVVFAAAAMLLLGGALWGPDPIYGFDTVHEKYMWRDWVFSAARAGELPTWCPYVLGGIPLVSDPIIGFWYPPVALAHLLLPTGAALNATWFVHLVIAAMGMYVLLRDRAGKAPAAIGATSYAFGAWMVGHVPLGGLPHIATCAWTPWVFWAVLRIIERAETSARDVGVAALVTGACVLGGHMQFVYSTALGLALFVLANVVLFRPRVAVQRLSRFALVGVAAVVGVSLAAVMLLPWTELLEDSHRAGALPDLWAYFGARMTPIQLIAVVAPTFFGDSVSTPYWGFPTQGMVTPYLGIPALVLAIACRAPTGRVREAWSLRVLLVTGAVLAFGHRTPLYDLSRDWVPLFDRLRHPARWLHLVVFAGAWLASLGLAGLLERTRRAAGGWPLARAAGLELLVALALAVGLALAALDLGRGGVDRGPWRTIFDAQVQATTLPGRDPLREGEPAALRDARAASVSALRRSGMLAAATVCVLGWAAIRRRGAAPALPVVVLLVADLVTYGRPYAIPFPRELIEWDPALVALVGPPDPMHRMATSIRGRTYPYPGQLGRSHGNLSSTGQSWMHLGLLSGHLSAQGVFGSIPRSYMDVAFDPGTFDPSDARLGPQGVLDLLAVDTWLLPDGEQPDAPGWSEVGRHAGVHVWRNEHALARAFFVRRCEAVRDREAAIHRIRGPGFDPRDLAVVVGAGCPAGIPPDGPGGTVTLVVARDESLELDARSDAGGLIVVSDTFFPGWTATVDGAAVPIHRVNLAVRGVVVPPGEHRVRFEYRARRVAMGAAVSLVAVLVLAALLRRGPAIRSERR